MESWKEVSFSQNANLFGFYYSSTKCNPDALSNLEQISVRLYLFMHSQALSGILWVVPCGTTGYPATSKLNPGSLWFVPCIVKSGPDILPSLFINHNYKDGEILPDMRHYRISGHSLALSKIFRVDLCILKSGPIIYFPLYLLITTTQTRKYCRICGTTGYPAIA